MSKLVLYNPRPNVAQDTKGWKKFTIPNQSMTLQEILRRFVKREPLPLEHEGTFYDGEYDLEKLSKADRTEQDEVLSNVRDTVKRLKDDISQNEAKEKAAKKARIEAKKAEKLKQQDPKV